MKTPYHVLLVIFVLSLLVACGGAPKKKAEASGPPAWVNGDTSRYPDELFLVGLGQGIAQPIAKNGARAELMNRIRVRVKSETLSDESVQQTIRDNKMVEVVNRDMRQTVKTTSDIEFDDIDVKFWSQPGGEVFAIALLDRNKADTRLRQDIRKLDEQIQTDVQLSETSTDPLKQIGYVIKAKTKLAERNTLNDYLRVIGGTAQGMPSQIGQAQLDEMLDRLQRNIKFSVSGLGSYGNKVSEFALGELAESGFATTTEANAQYVMKVTLDLNPPRKDKQWYWVRGKLEVVLENTDTKGARGSHSWSLKQSATDAPTANDRSVEKARKIFADELTSVIMGFAQH